MLPAGKKTKIPSWHVESEDGARRGQRTNNGAWHCVHPAPLPRGVLNAGVNGTGLLARGNRTPLPSANASGVIEPVCSAERNDVTSRTTTEPLTVAGPRRIHTGFRLHGPFTHFDCETTLARRVPISQPLRKFAGEKSDGTLVAYVRR